MSITSIWPEANDVIASADPTAQTEPPLFANAGDPFPAEYESQIAHLDAPVQQLFRDYFPHAWMRPSPFLEDKYVMTMQALSVHIQGAEAERAKAARTQAKEQRTASATAWLEWQEQCKQRNAWIAGKMTEWKRRVAQRKAALADWDAYVEDARVELCNARATAVPERPPVRKG